MKNKKIFYIIMIISIILTLWNIVNFINHKKKRYLKQAINIGNSIKNVNLNILTKLNDPLLINNNGIHFTYFIKVTDCSVCLFNMNMSLKKIMKFFPESKINIIIVYNDNIEEVRKYVRSYYNVYYNRISFFFATDDFYVQNNIRFTPCLLTSMGKIKLGITFNDKNFFNNIIKMLVKYYD